jgi:hypothetical protein
MLGIMVTSPRPTIAQTDGEHDDGEGGLPEHRPNDHPLGQHTDQCHRDDGTGHGQPEGKAEHGHCHQPPERAEHHEIALRKTHRLGGLVDQNKAQRDQAVNTALRNAADDQL